MSRIALVTGGTRGIGRAISERLAKDGYKVAANYAGNDEAAGRCAADLGIKCFKWDVGDYEACAAGLAEVAKALGPVDVLVNNAGINMTKRLADLEIGDWDRVFDTNLKSVYLMCKAVWPGFQSRRAGNIVNVASIMGQVGGVGSPAYCSTKASIIMLSRCLAKDGAQYGIRVNSVCPGYIDTPIMERQFQTLPDPVRARQDIVDRMPLGRMGIPEDIAAGILFLASTEAAYISGSELTIDGAVTATQID